MLNLKNKKNNKPLDTNTHGVYIRMLFSALNERCVQYDQNDFEGKGGFLAVVKTDWTKKKASYSTIGTKRNKARFDENGDEKFQKLFNYGLVQPYKSMKDLQSIMAMELGRQLGVRGGSELTKLKWSYGRLVTHQYEPNKNKRYVVVAPGGGFDKSHQLGIRNPTVTMQHPTKTEDPNNLNCIVNLIFFYCKRCDRKQERFFCHINAQRRNGNPYYFKPKSPIGSNPIRDWIR